METEIEIQNWIKEYGSGSLRRAVEEDMLWQNMYFGERAALEFGYGFEAIFHSRITVGPALASSDDPITTETCWWVRALRYRAKRDNHSIIFKIVYATVEEDNKKREGIGILCKPDVRPPWLSKDRILIAFTSNEKGTINPC